MQVQPGADGPRVPFAVNCLRRDVEPNKSPVADSSTIRYNGHFAGRPEKSVNQYEFLQSLHRFSRQVIAAPRACTGCCSLPKGATALTSASMPNQYWMSMAVFSASSFAV